MMAAKIHVEPADNNWHSRVGTHGDQEQSSIFQVVVMVDSDKNTKACNRYADRYQSEQEPMLEFIRKVSNDHGKGKSARPRWYGKKLSPNCGVAVGCNDGRGKEGIAVCRHN